VGGCVRDLLIGVEPKDFDGATDAQPEQVRKLFRNCRLVGRRVRLAHVFFGRGVVEGATFRAASAPAPGEETLPETDPPDGEEREAEQGALDEAGGEPADEASLEEASLESIDLDDEDEDDEDDEVGDDAGRPTPALPHRSHRYERPAVHSGDESAA